MSEKILNIFNTPWHIANQYELYKLPQTQWHLIINNIRRWDKNGKSYRPVPTNVTQVAYYEPGKYDLAILHVDQQCIDEGLGKSKLYRQLNEQVKDVPKIVINHGTPYWPEKYRKEDGSNDDNWIKMKMKMLIGNNHMVVNSHKALEMWGPMGKTTRAIIHGLDPSEWWDLAKEPRVITMLSPAGLDRYYNRKLLELVKERLREKGIPHDQITVDWHADDFDDYREFVGRSLIYFNPTLESPMPRSRTEAMLSGCCIVTLANHGAEKFIKQGENGFLVPNNPEKVVDLIVELYFNHYKRCIEIGKKGKETAMIEFGKDRFQKDWMKTINEVLGYNFYEL